ncbi:hypothetical protein B0F90DRAFT_1680617 [Multifurca ochricompacta]|uniref:DUF1754-domain-containing protein n=1 Tax=Multifurca ochricompacta TaxID=376703 RepID=A0AAD4QQN7_9AGAM|nr:hypothetical protein B0F90DRAFT_1680617 [Multifurca ochricompacta]
MSEYDFRPGGSLKLKGVVEGGVVKKKKKPKGDRTPKDTIQDDEPAKPSPSGSNRSSPAIAGSSSDDRKTAAEKRFQGIQRKRLADKVKKLAGKTHKDRVHEFNTKLETLSEHHDIPKVGPG